MAIRPRKELLTFARKLRKAQTKAEKILWAYLKGYGLGVKARRNAIVNGFIPDFYFPQIRLIVEIDGTIHQTDQFIIDRDRWRQGLLTQQNFKIIRFTNDQVISGIDSVIAAIKTEIQASLDAPQRHVKRVKYPKMPLPLHAVADIR
jgi:very-short-patch-repair endonuclease